MIVGCLPATRDPVGPDVGDEPLVHVGVLAAQAPVRAVEGHRKDPADASFVVVEGRVGVVHVAAAEYQLARVAKARGLAAERVRGLVGENTEGRTLGVLGEPRVNVLKLNIALDRASK